MRNKRFEVTLAEVNSKVIKVIDVPITITTPSPSLQTDVGVYFPIEIQIINDCGAGVEFLILANQDEVKEYDADPSGYSSFIRIPKNAVLSDDFTSFNRCLKFLVRGYETTATSDLVIEFINYKRSMQ